jgi:hypothetical protein
MSPNFEMLCVNIEDVEAMGDLELDAFAEDHGQIHWWSPDKEIMRQWLAERSRRKLLRDPTVRFFKIVDKDNGKLVAWSRWEVPKGMNGLGSRSSAYEEPSTT